MACQPGHLCLKHSNLIIIILVTLIIFVLYVFQLPDSNFHNNAYNAYNANTSSSKEIVAYNDEEAELRKEKLRQEIVKIREESKVMDPSHPTHLKNKAYERIINPLLPPERSYESTYGVPINVPTRGPEGGYQQIGYLYKDDISDDNKKIGNNSESVILPLYGSPTFSGSNKWRYYISSDKYHSIKMPITHKNKECDNEHGCEELYDNDVVSVPSYNGEFKTKIYEFDKPRYIPYVF